MQSVGRIASFQFKLYMQNKMTVTWNATSIISMPT